MGSHEKYPDLIENQTVPPNDLGRIALRQQLIATNFVERIVPHLANAGEDGALLLGHQATHIRETQAFFTETHGTVGRRILWPSPPNFGKTALSAVVARSVGIGDAPSDPDRLRGLVFVPRRIGRTHMRELYAHLAPEIAISEFSPREGYQALQHADMLAMTYKAGSRLDKEALDYIGRHTDLVILDEVHRGIGPWTSSALNYLFDRYGPTILAMSATYEFNEDHSATKVFDIIRSIKPITPRESIEKGLSNGVEMYAIFSGVRAHFTSKRDGITATDVEGLKFNEARNNLIIDLIEEMTLDGRQGIAQCLQGPGSGETSNAHPILIAKMASERRIIDPDTGEERFLRVEAVGNHRKDNDEVIARFKRGELDALTFCRYLIEMFDHPIRYIIYGTPSTSRVDVDQLAGRGARRSEDSRPTMLFYLTDHYTSRVTKRLKTPFQTYDVDIAQQGLTIIPQTIQNARGIDPDRHILSPEERQKNPSELNRPYVPGELTGSRAILNALAKIPPGTILEQEIVVAESPEIPSGYIPLQNLPVVAEGKVTMEGAMYILQQKVEQDSDMKLLVLLPGPNGRKMLYVSPTAQEYLMNRYQEVGEKVTRAELNNFLAANGWPGLQLEVYLEACAKIGAPIEVVKKAIVIEPLQAEKLLLHLAATPLVDPHKELSLALLASVLDTHTSVVSKLAKKDSEYGSTLVTRRKSLPPQQYRHVQAMPLEVVPDFIEFAATRSERLAAQVAILGISGVIEATQRQYTDYYEKYNLVPILSKGAIQSFTASMQQTRDEPAPANPTRQTPRPENEPANTAGPVSAKKGTIFHLPAHPHVLQDELSHEWMDLGILLDLANCTPLAARYIAQMVHGEHLIRHDYAKRIEVNNDLATIVQNACNNVTRRVITTQWVPVTEAEQTLRAIGKNPKDILPHVTQKLFRSIDGATGRIDIFCHRDELNKQTYRPGR